MLRTVTANICRQLSIKGVISRPQHFSQTRNLFTKDFLGVSVFLQRKEIALRELSDKNVDISTLRKDILTTFGVGIDAVGIDENAVVQSQETPANILLSDDVRRIIYTSKCSQVII